LNIIAHYTDNQSIFKNLISCTDKLITADESWRIVRREDVIINLFNRFTTKLDNVLFVSNIEINLLFTQALLVQKIENHNLIQEVKFNWADKHEIIVKDFYKDRTSYLTWVKKWKDLV